MRKGILNYLVIAVFAISAAFTSCEKKNNDDKNNNGNNTGNPDSLDNPNTGNSNIVSRLICYNVFEGGKVTIDYTYDNQNRPSKINFNGNSWMSFSYPSTDKIQIGENGTTLTFTLNNDGYVIKTDVDYDGSLYEYLNGYLQKEIIEGKYGSSTHFTWGNSNLLSVICEDWEGKIDTTTYSYGTLPNKESNIAPWSPPTFEDFGLFLVLPSNWFGKTSKNLVSSMNYNDSWGESYRYETNSNGYVTKVYTTSIKSGTESLKFEIQYK